MLIFIAKNCWRNCLHFFLEKIEGIATGKTSKSERELLLQFFASISLKLSFIKTILLSTVLCCILPNLAFAQPTIGLIEHAAGSQDDGYILFAPLSGTTTYLIDKCGKKVRSWSSTAGPGMGSYLLPDGNMLRPAKTTNAAFPIGGAGGRIQKFDLAGNLTWNYLISDSTKMQHHDIKALPNGNVLVIAYEKWTDTQAVAMGRNPLEVPPTLLTEQILEIEPIGLTGGNIVWEWHLWDHLAQDFDATKPNFLPINVNPQLLNFNYRTSAANPDWIHLNSIDYNATLEQILVSGRDLDEIWIINHSTTTAEAAGHTGGQANSGDDFLYRWGNSEAYNVPGAGQLFGQHNAHWIDTVLPHQGQIMIFNNGAGRPMGNYSTVEIIDPPRTGFTYKAILPYLPALPTTVYNAGNIHQFFSSKTSGAQELSNGNLLVSDGPDGTMFEVDTAENVVWKYINPTSGNGIAAQGATPSLNNFFRGTFYAADFMGFAGQVLVVDTILENENPISDSCGQVVVGIALTSPSTEIKIFPNPANNIVNVELASVAAETVTITLVDAAGREIAKQMIQAGELRAVFQANELASGLYFLKISRAKDDIFRNLLFGNRG